MSILEISGSSSNLYQYLQSLSSATRKKSTTSQAVGAANSDGDSVSAGSTHSTTNISKLPDNSSISSGAPSLVQQLETSIQDAVNGVHASQSNDSKAVLSAIEQAIQNTLQNNGINSNQLLQTGHPHRGHHFNSTGRVYGALGTNRSSFSRSSNTSASSNPLEISQTPGLEWLLSQLNIDPQQFRNDVISALPGSQNGNLDQSQVFQSFPVGQNVNVLP